MGFVAIARCGTPGWVWAGVAVLATLTVVYLGALFYNSKVSGARVDEMVDR